MVAGAEALIKQQLIGGTANRWTRSVVKWKSNGANSSANRPRLAGATKSRKLLLSDLPRLHPAPQLMRLQPH